MYAVGGGGSSNIAFACEASESLEKFVLWHLSSLSCLILTPGVIILQSQGSLLKSNPSFEN